MNLIELITNIEKFDEESALYVKRINGEFSYESEVTIPELTEEELEWKTNEVSDRKCPGFEYFMEIFLIKEFIEDLEEQEYPTLEKKCKRLIYYAEFDA
tara:strand:+ start:730 stop:1026 length:297 start_codon:yes stop_codon:yes gene_type:complete